MKEEIEYEIKNLWEHHRSSSLGVILGLVFAVFVLVFGFWNMLFVVICSGIGLYIGRRLDNGENVVAAFMEYVKDKWRRG